MTPMQRKLLITAGAVLTAALLWFAPASEEDSVSEPAKVVRASVSGPAQPTASPQAGARSPQAAASSPEPALQGAERGSLKQKEANLLFAKNSWVVLPPPSRPVPPPPPPPPPPPSAPPLPFVYMGQFEQGDTRLVILNRGNRVLTAAAGDVLDNTYRIDSLDTAKVMLTYLPLGISQTLSTGGTQ